MDLSIVFGSILPKKFQEETIVLSLKENLPLIVSTVIDVEKLGGFELD